MARLWLTYAWRDNETNDVDFIVQTLEHAGLTVTLDRYYIGAGGRLWEQIERGIVDPATDAWAIFATASSLASEACREEMAIALDRALTTRDDAFPLIGIFPQTVERDLVPALIRTRLYVSVSDPDWTERVVAN